MTDPQPTAAVLLIGDEILSGRTKDKNLGFIADYLAAIGIDLKEARVVSDQEEEIANAVNALRHRYTYLFTTGGIGPTHDDITTDAVARAFGLPVHHDPQAVEILLAYFREMGREPNEARMRMARVPQGASLIDNPVSKAPGFQIGNVFVMAGVPKIMTAMLEDPRRGGGCGKAPGRDPEGLPDRRHRLLSLSGAGWLCHQSGAPLA